MGFSKNKYLFKLKGTLQLKSGINKNNMAINIFASHDIREETA